MRVLQSLRDAHHARSALTPSAGLEALQQQVQPQLELVNQRIVALAKSNSTLIPAISSHISQSGGKRLRPMLLLACAQLVGANDAQAIPLAAAVEYLHTASLLHDDVVDESPERRGKPTANALWGDHAPVLVGDYMLAQAICSMVEVGSLAAIKLLSDAFAVISEGEVLQLEIAHNTTLSEADYYRIITAKTAALFAAACEMPALIANTSTWQAPLRSYGTALGIAFQLADDALDYSAVTTKNAKFGKRAGDDYREGKLTLPLIIALERSNKKDKARLLEGLGNATLSDEAFADIYAIITQYDGIDYCLHAAEKHIDSAIAALHTLPEHPARDALEETGRFCVKRQY